MVYHLERAVGLHPKLCGALLYLNFCSEFDWKIVSGFRTAAEQDALFTSGGGVTGAKGGQSAHNYGLAVDIQPSDDKGTNVSDDPRHPAYAELGSVAPMFGLRYGIHLPSGEVDHPHLEVEDWQASIEWVRNLTLICAGLALVAFVVR